MKPEPSDSILEGGLSRRAVLGGAAGAAFLTSLGLELAIASPAWASSAPNNAPAMAALAQSSSVQGRTLAQLQQSPMVDSPWSTYAGDWCAVLASWLTSNAGGAYHASSSDLYHSFPAVSPPQIGDIIYYVNSQTAGHTGVVVALRNGIPSTIEGNTHTHPWPSATVNSYSSPWASGYSFSRPAWAAPSNDTSGDEDMKLVNYNNVDYLIGPQFIFASPDAITTNMMSALYGISKALTSAGEVNLACRPLGIPDGTYATLAGGQAWTHANGKFTSNGPY